MTFGSSDLLSRRREALDRLEQKRFAWTDRLDGFILATKAWAGSPRSLLQLFVAGVLTEQALSLIRNPILSHSLLRPLTRLLGASIRGGKLP